MDNDMRLKSLVENIFIQKDVDMNKPIVLASLISAASGMSLASNNIIDSETTRDELLNLYCQSENESLRNLSYLNSNYVKVNIGYSVEFEDYDKASACYNSQKQIYDSLYNQIAQRSKEHQQTNGKSM